MRRLIAIVLVAVALSPGLFWRDGPSSQAGSPALTAERLRLPPGGLRLAPGVTLAGAWRLDGPSESFGSYSALLRGADGGLLALSDRGRFLRLAHGPEGPRALAVGAVGGADERDKRLFDIEAAAGDPQAGPVWLAYEGRNAIRRFDVSLARFAETRPPEMREWPSNRGPEAMTRLADGRFVVLSEALGGWSRPFAEGLLFAGDPLAGVRTTRFHFVPPAGFRPTDMAQLPDGRVVVLLRRIDIALPPRFASRLVVADPATIRPGEDWEWAPLAPIAAPHLAENYEGLAIEPHPGGAARMWLISDDNNAAFQRTLLLALDWGPRSSDAVVAKN